MTQDKPLIFGIDPGFDRLGWSIGQIIGSKCRLISFGLIETKRHQTIFERYHDLYCQTKALVAEFKPQEVALESLFFYSNQKTVITVAQARGVILSAFLDAQIKCFEYSPPQIKLAVTGHGRADKKAVEKMIRQEFKLATNNKIIDDSIDAMAVLLTHATSRKLANST